MADLAKETWLVGGRRVIFGNDIAAGEKTASLVERCNLTVGQQTAYAEDAGLL